MDVKFCLQFISVLVTVVLVIGPGCVEGSGGGLQCVKYCGNGTGEASCPSGYSCVVWDTCGRICLRTGQYQPDNCPMKKCQAISCPLGFIRYTDTLCEGCTCANENLVGEIESRHKGSGCVPLVSTLCLLAVAYTSLTAAIGTSSSFFHT